MFDHPHPAPPQPPAAFQRLFEAFVDPESPSGRVIEILSDPDVSSFLASERTRSQSDWADLARYAQENAVIAASRRSVDAVFIGDSITQMWPFASAGLFGESVVSRGIGGQVTPQILLRFYADVVALKPKVVHILAGINDVTGQDGPNSLGDYKNHMRAMVDLARANDIVPLIASILPTARYDLMPDLKPAGRVIGLNTWLKELCAETGAHFIDYFEDMRNSDDGMDRTISNDGLHPNRDGYLIMTRRAREALAGALRSPAAVTIEALKER